MAKKWIWDNAAEPLAGNPLEMKKRQSFFKRQGFETKMIEGVRKGLLKLFYREK
tara:strand:- start:342 stop:503 length:162 start_codon:yes stop_codon:yes gene_type:complete